MKIIKRLCGAFIMFLCFVGFITWNENTQETNNMTIFMFCFALWLLLSKSKERARDKEKEEKTKEEFKSIFKALFKAFSYIANIGASILGTLFFGLFTLGGIASGIAHKSNEDLKKGRKY